MRNNYLVLLVILTQLQEAKGGSEPFFVTPEVKDDTLLFF